MDVYNKVQVLDDITSMGFGMLFPEFVESVVVAGQYYFSSPFLGSQEKAKMFVDLLTQKIIK